MTQKNSEDDLGKDDPLSDGLTTEQRERLRRVQQKLDEGDDLNPNLVDTPGQAAAHGFVWKRTPFGS